MITMRHKTYAMIAAATLLTLASLAGSAWQAFGAETWPICQGSNRYTCVVDGDTIWFEGEKIRLLDIDTPELSSPECPQEALQAAEARDRLAELVGGGIGIERDGKDRYGRTLAKLKLADGRYAGDALLNEGLAQPWPNEGNAWCGR